MKGETETVQKAEMAGEEQSRTRIFFGGLGEGVTREDLEKILSQKSLGKVEGIQLIRTKGRSFAYVDFSPSDDRSLSKLFSTYNGCLWKGGRLRLERAKEHYLVHLKREWAEDAQNAAIQHADSGESKKSLEVTRKIPNQQKLRIYFPRLGKVKALPFSGTGKHKYSFQRVNVPAFPVHFCDCEEHSTPYNDRSKQTHDPPEDATGGINEEELKIMTSVMNRLIQKENHSDDQNESIKAMDCSNSFVNDIHTNEIEEDCSGDKDDLIINMVSKEDSRKTLSVCREQRADPESKRSKFDKGQTSKDGVRQESLKVQRASTFPKMEAKLIQGEEGRKEVVSNIKTDGDTIQAKASALKGQLHCGTKAIVQESGIQLSTANISRTLKSSWKKLIGDESMVSFSISHVLPDNASSEEGQPHSNSINVSLSTNSGNEEQKQRCESSVHPQSCKRRKSDAASYTTSDEGQAESNGTDASLTTYSESEEEKQRCENSVENQSSKRKNFDAASGQAESNSSENASSEEGEAESDGTSVSLSINSENEEEKQRCQSSVENQSCKRKKSDVASDIASSKEGRADVSLSTNSENDEEKQRCETSAEDQSCKRRKSDATSDKGRGVSWMHKSSWTQLVNENNGLFSISNILPESRSLDVADSAVTTDSELLKQGSGRLVGNASTAFSGGCSFGVESLDRKYSPAALDLQNTREELQFVMEGKRLSPSVPDEKRGSASNNTTIRDAGLGETCPFMRNAASLKAWSNAKVALSGSLKKRKSEKKLA